jgi:S-adenosylmethionine-diacylglycerol 3-amino-3-carboxypropyl transferase
MQALVKQIRRWEFEARIFISLGIVFVVCVLSYVCFGGSYATVSLIGRLLGLTERASLSSGFLLAALLMAVASLLRMWAGSILTSSRVMAFRVQKDKLLTRGPYRFVRNPIYLADLIAMCGFALCLPPSGVLLPVLIYLHYLQLVKYEEISLATEFGQEYIEYARRVPRLLLGPRTMRMVPSSFEEFQITPDGLRHNALYVLFAAGFIIAGFTREFFHAVAIGLPGVYDWAVLHTKKGLPKSKGVPPTNGRESRRRRKKVFEDILYAQCWEDPALDRIALNIGPDDVVFSITSGGCNTLTFLLDDPAEVIALDISPYQNYLLELKIAAFRRLNYDELLEFVGVRQSERRLALFERIRAELTDMTQAYWDRQVDKIRNGIIHCGRYEGYMRFLRLWVRRLIGGSTIQELFATDNPDERLKVYHDRWENLWWWIFTRILLSRAVMTLIFDKAFFKYLDTTFSFGKHFARRVKRALTQLPMKENYFLSYILLGRYFSEDFLPPYLRKENFEIVRGRIDRIQIVTESCEQYFARLPDNSVSKFNFTNIFEWMSPEAYERLLRQTIRVGSDHALLTYRNLLVHRERPVVLADQLDSLRMLAQSLHGKDLSFIYSNYVVEQINKRGVPCATPLGRYATAGR